MPDPVEDAPGDLTRCGTGPTAVVASIRKASPAHAGPVSHRVIVRGWSQIWAVPARLGADHMVRNSLYLILSSALQAVLGLAFWLIAARTLSAADIGRGASLIAAVAVIAYAAQLGLNSTFVRYLPTAQDRDVLITGGMLVVAVAGASLAVIYVFATPLIAPRLAFIERPILAVGFVLITAASAVNLLADAVFIAVRRAGCNALVDGGVGGGARVLGILALAGTGAYGVFGASGGGFAAAALASLLLMAVLLKWRPSLRQCSKALRPLLRFSGASYVGNLAGALPGLVVPLIVLDRLGAPAAAYYFVGFQLASILFSAVSAVEQTFLTEGAYAGGASMTRRSRRELLQRSRRLLMVLCLPACLVLVLAAHWVLLAFGVRYSQHGTASLMLLAVAAAPIAANNWLWTVLRLAGQLRSLVLSGVVYASAICGLSWLLAPHGLAALAAAWPLGSLLSAVVAAVLASSPVRNRQTVTP
jgi:O-antigen/teichoic acid export membrane protein